MQQVKNINKTDKHIHSHKTRYLEVISRFTRFKEFNREKKTATKTSNTKTFIRDNWNFDSSEFDSTGVKLYIFIHNEVRDFDKNSTQPKIRVNRIRDESRGITQERESGKVMGGFIVLNSTFNNISVISWRSVLLVEETGVPGENHRPNLIT
jgi:hypothetical protein